MSQRHTKYPSDMPEESNPQRVRARSGRTQARELLHLINGTAWVPNIRSLGKSWPFAGVALT
jgi:hypothetical protein